MIIVVVVVLLLLITVLLLLLLLLLLLIIILIVTKPVPKRGAGPRGDRRDPGRASAQGRPGREAATGTRAWRGSPRAELHRWGFSTTGHMS